MRVFSFFRQLVGLGKGEMSIVESGEPDVATAVAAARESLHVFWAAFDAGAAEDFQLKAALTTPSGGVEHVWVEPVSRMDDKLVGRLLVNPYDLPDVRYGDEIVVDADRISDWGYMKAGRLYGAYTQRALLAQLPPGKRREFEAVLSPTPLAQ